MSEAGGVEQDEARQRGAQRTAPRGEDPGEDPAEEAIRRVSPEGRPAHPHFGPRQISLRLATMVVVILALGLVLALTVNRVSGIIAAVLGLLIFFASPEFWASLLRARERRRAVNDEDSKHEERVQRPAEAPREERPPLDD